MKKEIAKSPLNKYEKLSNRKLNQTFSDACLGGKLKTVQLILNNDNLKNRIVLDFLHYSDANNLDKACFSGNLKLVQFLINYESNLLDNKLYEKFNNALIMAGEFEHLNIVKFFLETPTISTHINSSHDNHEFINAICSNSKSDILDYLLNSKTSLVKYNVNKINDGIHYACDNNNYAILKCIFEKLKNQDKKFEVLLNVPNNSKALEYLICDYGIEKTPFIEKLIKDNEQIPLNKWFSKQDLHKKLNNMESKDIQTPRKMKI